MNSDLNNDGTVDVFDLSILLSEWGTTGTYADINNDGIVDALDLSILLGDWSDTTSALSAPQHVLAFQGPTDPNNLYVWITWRYVDGADEYEIYRDDVSIGTVTVTADTWNSCAFKDTGVSGSMQYDWTVVARSTSAGSSSPSAAVSSYVRSNADIGSIYNVTRSPYNANNTGAADAKPAIQAAINDARTAGGGIVYLPAGIYLIGNGGALDDLLLSNANNVIIRGDGESTVIKANGDGGSTVSGGNPAVITFRGTRTTISATLQEDIEPGATTITVDNGSLFSVGSVYYFDQTVPRGASTAATTANVTMDPGTPRDDSHSYDILKVTAINGNVLTVDRPVEAWFTISRGWLVQRLHDSAGCQLEQIKIQGRSSTEATHANGVSLDGTTSVRFSEVSWEHFTAHVRSLNSSRVVMVSCHGGKMTPIANQPSSSAVYMFSMSESPDLRIISSTFGVAGNAVNCKSHITLNRAHRTLVRNSRFFATRSYNVNWHGFSTRSTIIENCYFDPTSAAQRGALFHGNSSWGFDGNAIIRNNKAISGPHFLYIQENGYGVRVLDNHITGIAPNAYVATAAVIRWYGWDGPDTVSGLEGSAKLTVRRNAVLSSNADGLWLAADSSYKSPHYPFDGVRDVIIKNNDWSGLSGNQLVTPAGSAIVERVPFDTSGGDPEWAAEQFSWESV